MPKVYITDRGIASVLTGTTAVHELPYQQRIITGITPPAAGAGAKQLAGKARVRMETVASVGRDFYFSGTALMRITPTADIHTANNPLDGIMRMRITTPRCELTAGGAGVQVTFRAAGTGFAANNGGGAISLPTRVAGDLLIMMASARVATGTLGTSSSGWNVGAHNLATGEMRYWWRIATNDANDNFTLTYTSGGNGETVLGRMFSYVNVHATNPFEDRGDYQAQPMHALNGSASTYGMTQPVNAANPPTTYRLNSLQYGMQVAFLFLEDDNTATTPTLTAGSGSPANSAAEDALFPFTLTGWHASTLGSDASMIVFHMQHTTASISDFGAWGSYGWTTGVSAGSLTATAGLRPANAGTPNVDVWLPGRGNCKWSATATIFAGPPKQLDGTLPLKQTLTGDLTRTPGKFLNGLLPQKFSVTGQLTAVGANVFDGILRMRSVANIAKLTTGTTHRPAGLLPVHWTSSAILTLNYMQARFVVPWRVWCDLSVVLKLGATLPLHQTATLGLTRAPGTGGGMAALHWTGTARLTMPLRASVGLHMLATAAADAQRRLAGSTVERISAPAALSVIRSLVGSLGARQTATATLTSVRAYTGQARMRSTATASLTSDRRLAGSAPILWRAYLDLRPVRPVRPPETDITVSPYTPPVDSETLPVQVESPSGNVYVEKT